MDELNTPMVMPPEESIPDWYDGKRINEVLFCQQFLKKHPMKCVRGRLFTVDGLIEDVSTWTSQLLPIPTVKTPLTL